MTTLFLDTSFIVALRASDDQWHARAVEGWRGIASPKRSFLTTTFILDEVATLLNSRAQHGWAVAVGTQLMRSRSVTMVHVDPRLLELGWSYFTRHADKRYSLTDCISFVVMQERGIREALTFDQHFSQAGFDVLPRP